MITGGRHYGAMRNGIQGEPDGLASAIAGTAGALLARGKGPRTMSPATAANTSGTRRSSGHDRYLSVRGRAPSPDGVKADMRAWRSHFAK